MRKLCTLFLVLLLVAVNLYGQKSGEETKTVEFRFVPGKNMFYIPWAGNGAELERLYKLVDRYRAEIDDGRIPVYVNSYCASLPTAGENLRTAFVRANRVKSELITEKGLKEADFITANYAEAFGGRKDLVVVTLRIPAKEEPVKPDPVVERPEPEKPQEVAQPRREAVPEEPAAAEPVTQIASVPVPVSVPLSKPYCFAVRTNVLYDALLLPTLGVEWRVNRDIGIKLDGSRSWWDGKHGKVQKVWMLSPEVRWYLLRDKRFYAGVSANFGNANIYKYALGGILSKDTGYQGSFWGAGLTVGYQLYLSRSFSVDFSLGLGYTRFEYDSFGIIDGVRVYKGRDLTKNFWGPTQAGVSLVWTVGGKR